MFNALKELISIPSITGAAPAPGMPFGREVRRALDKALEISKRLGFRTAYCGDYLGYAEIGQGPEMVAILAHLDVVPPGNGWTKDPFGGDMIDGKIYGRGTLDDKGPAIAALFAMKDILDSGKPIRKRIRFIFGCQEEGGDWIDIEYYKNHEELPVFGFTPDAMFPVIYGEKGVLQATVTCPAENSGFTFLSGGDAPNMVADYAKAILSDNTVLEETGKAAHGSLPCDGKNAITMIMEKAAAKGAPFAVQYMENIGWHLDGSPFGAALTDSDSGSLTYNAGKIFMKEHKIFLQIDIRYPISFTEDFVWSRLEAACRSWGWSIEKGACKKPVYIAKDSPLIKNLSEAYQEVTGDNTPPITMGGGTYARAMDNIVAFGAMFPYTENTEHQADECVPVSELIKAREIYRAAIEKLACQEE